MRTQEIKVFKFDELSDKAKERARDWYREQSSSDDWWESCYECMTDDLKEIGVIHDKKSPFYFSIGRDYYLHVNGASIYELEKFVTALLPDTKLRKWEYDILYDCIRLDTHSSRSSNTCLEYDLGNSLDAGRQPKLCKRIHDISEELSQAWIDFRHKLWKMLQSESEYQYSEEYVDENIKCNEYEFTENGKFFR